MRVRALDADHDWTFGNGKNSYKTASHAVAQIIQTRLLMFLGDCFFATNFGIDWFNLLGGKDQRALNLAVGGILLGTKGVISILELSVNLDDNRKITISYAVTTIFSGQENPVAATTSFLLTEDGDILTTEDGDLFHA